MNMAMRFLALYLQKALMMPAGAVFTGRTHHII
jgi:hypothetical protein